MPEEDKPNKSFFQLEPLNVNQSEDGKKKTIRLGSCAYPATASSVGKTK